MDYPHVVAASFSELPDVEDRPHVRLNIADTKFWALLDTGASISLVARNAVAEIIKFYPRIKIDNNFTLKMTNLKYK